MASEQDERPFSVGHILDRPEPQFFGKLQRRKVGRLDQTGDATMERGLRKPAQKGRHRLEREAPPADFGGEEPRGFGHAVEHRIDTASEETRTDFAHNPAARPFDDCERTEAEDAPMTCAA